MKKIIFYSALVLSGMFISCRKHRAGEPQATPPADNAVITDIYPLAGPEGTTVTITGSNLKYINGTDDPFIFFNNTAGKIANSSDTKIEASSPVGATSGLIQIQIQKAYPKVDGYNYTYTKPGPRWRILFLIVKNMDYTFTEQGSNKVRFVTGGMSDDEVALANKQCKEFADHAVLALSSGMQVPYYEIRTINLQHDWTAAENDAANNNNMFPRQSFLGANDDVTFDATVLIFPKDGVDTKNFIGDIVRFLPKGITGQTPNNGNKRTYATISSEGLSATNVNSFIREFGRSVTSYYYAASPGCLGKIDDKAADDFINTGAAGQDKYVRFQTKKAYVISDDAKTINTLYNYQHGFSHDYYSGSVANTKDLNTAIGIGQAQWNQGGPVTKH